METCFKIHSRKILSSKVACWSAYFCKFLVLIYNSEPIMVLNIWSTILMAASFQGLLLLIGVSRSRLHNKKAKQLLICLLFVILLTTLSNLWTAGLLYRNIPLPSVCTRGMVLLLGPILYFYALASIRSSFRFKSKYLLHLMPYLIVMVINAKSLFAISHKDLIQEIDEFVQGYSKISLFDTFQFAFYSFHLVFYLTMIYRFIHKIQTSNHEHYMVSLEQRTKWIKVILLSLCMVGISFAGITIYTIVKESYDIVGNVVYTLVLAIIVYLISYQAMQNNPLLAPGFDKKYKSQKLDLLAKEKLLARIIELLETEKVYRNHDLTLASLAKKTGTNSHSVSQVINEKLNKSFSELLNEYRIEEFKTRIANNDLEKYSITGIANAVGFSSKSSFNTTFKKLNNQTPSEYIKSMHNISAHGDKKSGLVQDGSLV
jgi:AraC-like DNA-binding protein